MVFRPKPRPRIIQAKIKRRALIPKYQMSTEMPVTIDRRADAPVSPPSIMLFGRRKHCHAITNRITPKVMTT